MRHLIFAFTILVVCTTTQANDLKIGIVGGGPSGLSAAHFLKKAGYGDVTVLEREREVGGKTRTVTYQGKTYEMGAIMSGPSYKEVIALSKEFNQPIIAFSKGAAAVSQYDVTSRTLEPMKLKQKAQYLAAAVEYESLYKRYARYLEEPGLEKVPKELAVPFSRWIKTHSRAPKVLEELLSHSFVSFGYGYLGEIPAAYVFRYFSPALLRSFIFGQVHMLENGYQALWKSVAQTLRVETGFSVKSVKHENGEWTVHSSSGSSLNFDVLIWTAPLDVLAQAADLPPQLETLFSKIQYQTYYSTLVEVEGLARGSGVITQNYQLSRQGEPVSWLYRWPSDTNVANFYTLAKAPLTEKIVGQKLHALASNAGFKIKRVITSIAWKYFPHFSEDVFAQNAYSEIEASQGRQGLYFGGEIMNFSTVEHSVEYSKNLVKKFFAEKDSGSPLSPAVYSNASGVQKLRYLWGQIVRTEYANLPAYSELSEGLMKNILGFLPSQLKRAFQSHGDFIADGRPKIIHKLGSVALFKFVPLQSDYATFDGLIRLSNAVDASGGTIYPSFSIKIPTSGHDSSINFNIGKSFDPQRVGNDPKARPDYNFFRDDKLYPFSNELPFEPRSGFGKAFKWVFDKAHWAPNYIAVDEMTKLMNRAAPRRFIFKAPTQLRELMPSDHYTDEREAFAKISPGSILFEVYESNGLNDPGRLVGRMVTSSRFIASRFGDLNLYFRHEAKELKTRSK